MNLQTPTDKLVALQTYYKEHPVEFVRHIFKAEPSGQQIDFILSATRPHARVVVKSCTASGKTTALAWLTFYFLLCYPNCKGLVTAPTSSQVNRVFRSELSLWHGKMEPVLHDIFEIMSDMIYYKGKKDTQFFSWITASADNKESFAGLHADKVVLFVDEASALPKEIFDTLYGTLSSGDTSFCLVSNPVRSEGAFYDLFQVKEDAAKDKWDRFTFTSFGAPRVDLDWIEEIKAYYGEDSDFYRMRVLGEFPRLSEAQFISTDLVEGAYNRNLQPQDYQNYPRILGCDVARFGSDSSVIVDRQGPKIHEIASFHGLNTIEFAERILAFYNANHQQYSKIAIDGVGVGAGVVDQLGRFTLPIMDVNVGTKSMDVKTYANLRSQLWGQMKEWLSIADIPKNSDLRGQLVGINYYFNNSMQLILESKKDMKRRGAASPDIADALSLTFAPVVYAKQSINKAPRLVTRTNTYLWA